MNAPTNASRLGVTAAETAKLNKYMSTLDEDQLTILLNKIEDGKRPTDPSVETAWVAWEKAVLRNHAIDRSRLKDPHQNPKWRENGGDVIQNLPGRSSDNPETLMIDRQRQESAQRTLDCVRRVLGSMDDARAEIFRLHLGLDETYTYEDIAAKLGVKEGTVKSRISRVRKTLKKECR